MRVMVMVKATKNSEAGVMPSEKLLADMGKFNEELVKAGALVDTGGLAPTRDGFRMRLASGKLNTTDGPFSESKEVVGGWAILEADSKAEILRLTTEFMELHRKHWPEFEGECEVRPIEFQANP